MMIFSFPVFGDAAKYLPVSK